MNDGLRTLFARIGALDLPREGYKRYCYKRYGIASMTEMAPEQIAEQAKLSIDELQMLTDHARRDSVLQYASVQLEAKRRILEKKIIPWGKLGGKILEDKT